MIPVSSTVIPIVEEAVDRSEYMALVSAQIEKKKKQKKPEKSIWRLMKWKVVVWWLYM